MLCYLLSIDCTCPKRQLRISFVTKGKAVTTTAAKSIYNDFKLSQKIFHEEYRFPPSESPPLDSNRVAIILQMKGEFCICNILYKCYTLIYKIRIYLQWYQVVRDVPRRALFSSFGLANFGSNSRCYLPRCSTKNIVLLLRTRQLWKQLALLFAEMFYKEFRSPPLESNQIELLFAVIFKLKGEFCISVLYKYCTLIYKIRLDYAQHVLPVCDVRTHREYWGYLFTRSLCDSCTSERYIESVSYEAFSALESTSTRSDFLEFERARRIYTPCLSPQSSLKMFWNDDVLTYSRPPEFIRHAVLFALES